MDSDVSLFVLPLYIGDISWEDKGTIDWNIALRTMATLSRNISGILYTWKHDRSPLDFPFDVWL